MSLDSCVGACLVCLWLPPKMQGHLSTLCVQQITNEALWELNYLIICWNKCTQVGVNLSAAYAFD